MLANGAFVGESFFSGSCPELFYNYYANATTPYISADYHNDFVLLVQLCFFYSQAYYVLISHKP